MGQGAGEAEVVCRRVKCGAIESSHRLGSGQVHNYEMSFVTGAIVSGSPVTLHIGGPRRIGLPVLVISVASSNYFVAQHMDWGRGSFSW